jgi:hypothetical protein
MPPHEPLVLDRFDVFVNTWGVGSHLRSPTAEEREHITRYFNDPANHGPDGEFCRQWDCEVPEIDYADVVFYPAKVTG